MVDSYTKICKLKKRKLT